MGKLIHIDIF